MASLRAVPSISDNAKSDTPERSVLANAYNRAGEDYLRYADGDPRQLFAFEGLHAFGDRRLWSLIDTKLAALRVAGQQTLRVVDAGCGPGTWLRRIVARALELGFKQIDARGFDLAEGQVACARRLSLYLSQQPGVSLAFETGDLTRALPEADGGVDLCLCLYGVLNHLPQTALPAVVAEFARVTRGSIIVSVKSVGSTPSIFIDAVDRARSFQQDHEADRCEIELKDGRRMVISCHLFANEELRRLFEDRCAIEDLRGLDLFHSRFAPDRRWNPPSLDTELLADELLALEEAYAHRPDFMDRAVHLLVVAGPKAEPAHALPAVA